MGLNRLVTVAFIAVIGLTGCDSEVNSPKCKGDRIPYQGQCVDPSEIQDTYSADVVVSVDAPTAPVNPYENSQIESSNYKCSDGIDNDNDGKTDCNDTSCQYNPFVNVCGTYENTDALCSDGIDNHPDLGIDCETASCFANPFVTVCGDPEVTYAACSDGIDNDADGFTDCDDFDCVYGAFVDENYCK